MKSRLHHNQFSRILSNRQFRQKIVSNLVRQFSQHNQFNRSRLLLKVQVTAKEQVNKVFLCLVYDEAFSYPCIQKRRLRSETSKRV